jgi:hypothetical protein
MGLGWPITTPLSCWNASSRPSPTSSIGRGYLRRDLSESLGILERDDRKPAASGYAFAAPRSTPKKSPQTSASSVNSA